MGDPIIFGDFSKETNTIVEDIITAAPMISSLVMEGHNENQIQCLGERFI